METAEQRHLADLRPAHRASSRLPVWSAATLSVVAAVALDIAGGAGPGHVAALSLLAVIVSALRVLHVGRHRLLFGLVSAALVAQPALHLVAEAAVVPGPQLDASTDWTTTVAHLMVALGVSVAVGSAEFHFARIERFVERAVWSLAAWRGRRPEPSERVGRPSAHVPARQLWEWVGYVARRGPPVVGTPVTTTGA